jgi:hypothetical protein
MNSSQIFGLGLLVLIEDSLDRGVGGGDEIWAKKMLNMLENPRPWIVSSGILNEGPRFEWPLWYKCTKQLPFSNQSSESWEKRC